MGRIRKMNNAEQEMWSRAIHRACGREWVPALRAAFAHIMPFVDEECPTAYTDCQYRVGVSPELLDPEKTTDEQLACVLIHETMHNTQHHRQRLLEKRGMNGVLGNYVTDLEINSIIAEGIFGIDLNRAPSASNGHWDWLFGEFGPLPEEDVEKYNKIVNDPNHTYKAGEIVYRGALLPRNGQFYDFPENKTAEQYLEMLDYDEVEMSWEQYQSEYGNGSGSQGDADQQGSTGQTCPTCGGPMGSDQDQDQDAQGGDGGNDANDGNDGNDGNQQGQNGQGNQPGQSDQNGSQPSQNGQGNHTCPTCGNPVDENGNAPGSGGSQGGSGGPSRGRVTVTRIFKKKPDGSREEVGRDDKAWVDRIDISPDSDVWKQASELGIDPITRGEEQRVKEQVAHDIEEQRRSNGYGSGAGNMLLDYVAKGLRPPVVDWKKMLRRVTSRACEQKTKGRDDFTWQRLSRRYSQGKYMFPGMMSYIPTVRFAIDTSGSMSQQEYHKALSEAEGILHCTRAKIECVCVDYEASEVRKVRSVKEITNEMVGGGGTDMGAALRQICEQKPKERPDVLVIATDGCYDWDRFVKQLAAPELKKTAIIVLLVYKFDEERYYAAQGGIDGNQAMMRKYHKDAKLVQAWV